MMGACSGWQTLEATKACHYGCPMPRLQTAHPLSPSHHAASHGVCCVLVQQLRFCRCEGRARGESPAAVAPVLEVAELTSRASRLQSVDCWHSMLYSCVLMHSVLDMSAQTSHERCSDTSCVDTTPPVLAEAAPALCAVAHTCASYICCHACVVGRHCCLAPDSPSPPMHMSCNMPLLPPTGGCKQQGRLA